MRHLALATLLLLAFPAAAAEPESAVPSPEFRKDALRLIEMTGTANLGMQIGASIVRSMYTTLKHRRPDLPERAFEVMNEVGRELFESERAALSERLVPVYARYYTHEDLKQLIHFYETPLGRKTLEVTPALMNDAVKQSQEWSRGIHPRLEPLLLERFKQEGLVPPDTEKLFQPN